MNKLIQTYLLPGIYKFTFSIAWAPIIGAGITTLGSMYTNKKNREMQYDMAKNGLGWKIEQAKKYGIHPLAAIGAAPTPMPTIPMQNPLGGFSSALNQTGSDPTEDQLKMLTIENLQNTLKLQKHELEQLKYSDQLVIPVEHKDFKGKKMWIWNPKFHVYGTIPTLVTAASNQDDIIKTMFKGMDTKQQAEARRQMQRRKKQMSGQFRDNKGNFLPQPMPR